ncbi:MAG: glycosyltransferase [Candidatus Pacebacteria bacterium]|nr:glycosyltransferase [Candidatus Paceibacterota bacterium]
MKILHVVPYFAPAWAYGGPPKAVLEIAKNQVRAGHKVFILTTTAFEKNQTLPAGLEAIEGITVTRLPNLSNWLMWHFHFCTPIGAQSYLRQNQFDVIHLHEVRTLLNLFTLLFGKTKKYFLSPWGTLPFNNSQSLIKKLFDLPLIPLLKKKIATSFAQTEHEALVLETFLSQKQTKIIPLGIDFTEFKKLPSKLQAREKLNLDPSAFYFLFLGRFSPHKGLKNLITAFAQLEKQNLHARLLLVGRDDGYLNTIHQLIETNSLQDSVTINTPLYGQDRLLAYCAADTFVFTPTVYEETGTVCLEALACNLPVITSEQAAIPFMRKEDGVITIHNTALAIVSAIKQLAGNIPPVNNKKIQSIFDWSAVSRQMIDSYQEKA